MSPPLFLWNFGVAGRIIKVEFASPDLEFVGQDPKDAVQIDVAYVGAGIMTVNEVRANMGLVPVNWGNAFPDSAPQNFPRGVVVKNSSATTVTDLAGVKKTLASIILTA